MKRIIGLLLLVAVVIGAVSLWRTYRSYENRKQSRIQRMQQQAEDTQITTIEGWTIDDMASYLDKQGLVSSAEFTAALENFDVSQFPLVKETKPGEADLEGYLFPDTYRFTKETTANTVIEKMLGNFSSRMQSLGVRPGQGDYTVPRYESVKLSFYELLTLASIVEKETGSRGGTGITPDQERSLIAGVFYNRLVIGQALESDATINYVTGKNTPGVSATDLEIESPYNTYKNRGLPPGPICNPSLASIKAVLNPADTDFGYFFHKQPSGEVVFSKTFDEHRRKRME